jgi:glycosyltransferase involved in cell wall biosynthesis
MKLEVLVSTMYQNDHSLLKKMNIQSDAIIINQCNWNKIEEFEYEGNTIRYLSFNERGIGLSRNNAIMRVTADICLLADDDMIYVDDYERIIIDAFKDNPSVDLLIFNVPSINPKRPLHISKQKSRVRWFNCLKYGAVRIAVRTERLKQANIYFSLLFGGGAMYSAGEDSLFIADCIKKGLKVYTYPKVIGYVSQETSTWFNGYTDKYFIDKGAFYACLSRKWAFLFCLQFAIRHRNLFMKERTISNAIKLMLIGVRRFNSM